VGIKKPSLQYLTIALAISTTIFLIILGLLQRRSNKPRIDQLQKCYQRLCARTGKISRPRRSSEGPQEYADAICKLRPDLATDLQNLFAAYISLRYDSSSDAQTTQQFSQAVARFQPG
jgi:hypothetical protein